MGISDVHDADRTDGPLVDVVSGPGGGYEIDLYGGVFSLEAPTLPGTKELL